MDNVLVVEFEYFPIPFHLVHDKNHMQLCDVATIDMAFLAGQESEYFKARFNQVRRWLQRNWVTTIDHPIVQSDVLLKSYLTLVLEGTTDPAHPGLVKVTAYNIGCFVCNQFE